MIMIDDSEIKKFMSAAKDIKDTRLLPIYAYVKLVCEGDCATFYKNNGHSYVSCVVKADFKKNITILIEEKKLFGLVSYGSGQPISFKIKGDDVIISDGNKSAVCPLIPDNYPAIQPKVDSEQTELDEEVISAMFLAKSHCGVAHDKVMRSYNSYVHTMVIGKKNYVVGVNTTTSYFKSFKQKLPIMNIEPETVNIIRRFNKVLYSVAGNYDYFDGGEICYGFIKSEVKVPDLLPILERFKSDKSFEVDRERLVKFCEMVMYMNSTNIAPEVSIINGVNGNLVLKYIDILDSRPIEETIKSYNKNFEPDEFIFQPKNMVLLLKELGVDVVKFSYIGHHYVTTSPDERDYMGSIMGLAKL